MNAPIAEFADYDGLRRALNAARENCRDMSFELMDEITGAPRGYFSKTLGPRASRRIGLQSLGWALGGLGVKCVLVEDPEALARIKSRLEPRDKAHLTSVMRANSTVYTVTAAHLRKIQPLGGKARAQKLTKAQLTRSAKKAAKARWKSHRKEMAKRARQRRATHRARKGK